MTKGDFIQSARNYPDRLYTTENHQCTTTKLTLVKKSDATRQYSFHMQAQPQRQRWHWVI